MCRPRSANRQGEEGPTAFFQAVIPWQPQAGSQLLLWSFLSLALIRQELFESAKPSYWHKTLTSGLLSAHSVNWNGSFRVREDRVKGAEAALKVSVYSWLVPFGGWWAHPKQAQIVRGDTGWKEPMAQHTWHNAPQHCCSSDMLLLQISCYIVLFSFKQKT